MEYVIVAEKNGIRIDKYIADKRKNLSRTRIQQLLEEGNILVNGKTIKASYRTEIGDKIEIQLKVPEPIHLQPEKMDLEILYEDSDILVVNKPKGLVVHPGNGNPNGTLANAAMAICETSLSGIGGKIRPGIVHRLDKDTSGVIIIAKNDNAHINLSEQIKNRKVEKIYIALVRGTVKEEEATINMPIARSKTVRTKMAVDRNGKEAVTHFKVLKRYAEHTLLQVKIETGRTHQIRVHLSQIGYPVVGDGIYSNGKNPFGVQGQMLHAYQIKFIHPSTGKEMKINAELPNYFEKILEQLKKDEI